MIKKILTLLSLSLSLSTHAATVTYNGYTLDTTTNIVAGSGIEWLRWDETIGMSINQALTLYSNDGWRLATNQEMADLLNTFNVGNVFNANENDFQQDETGWWTGSGNSTTGYIQWDPVSEYDVQFLALFGNTVPIDPDTVSPDPYRAAHAVFGGDADGDGLYNRTMVQDDYVIYGREEYFIVGGEIVIIEDHTDADRAYGDAGIALVRVSNVPLPASIWLFASTLVVLIGKKLLSS